MALQFDQYNNALLISDTVNTNPPAILQPQGTGGVQAQIPTSTATGGNVRGANSVDWQTTRSIASQVAAQSSSVIAGGQNNGVNASAGFIGGGSGNNVSGAFSAISGGYANQIYGQASTIGGGHLNGSSTQVGYLNFIGGGELNTGTLLAAVTTQATTIAVTAGTTLYLTSTNANVKVGQLVTGTGIVAGSGSVPWTYTTSAVTTGTPAVMATSSIAVTTGILTVGTLSSGTIVPGMVLTGTGVPAGTYIVSNISGSGSGSTWNTNIVTAVASTTITGTAYTFTISQAATTTAGVTLSFYTPHGVVVGGGNNQATGSYSFIGGGGDAGTASQRNTASGDYSVVVGGIKNTASGIASFVGGGGYDGIAVYTCTAAGVGSAILGGLGNSTNSGAIGSSVAGGVFNSTTGTYCFVGGGYTNVASGTSSGILNGRYGLTRSINGFTAFPSCASPISATAGVSQGGLLILARQTTDATATVLASDANTPSGVNQLILPNNSAYYVRGSIVAGVTGAGNSSSWTFQGTIKRGAAAVNTSLVAPITATLVSQDVGAATWAVAITADTTNGGLAVTVTGAAATTIRWVCKIETTEMTF